MSFAPSSSSTSSEPASKVRKIENGVEYFPTVPKIEYAGPKSVNPLSYRYYNPNEIILGKPMKDWLRFSVCFWHTVRITYYLQLVTPININSKHIFLLDSFILTNINFSSLQKVPRKRSRSIWFSNYETKLGR